MKYILHERTISVFLLQNAMFNSVCCSFSVIIKLACESQLTEILFKLIIKLACESQLTEILFKLIIIKLACESQLTEILFKLIIIILLRLNFWLLLLLEL